MIKGTPQVSLEPRIAISISRAETMALLEILRGLGGPAESSTLGQLYSDMEAMARRRRWKP